jgi:hypothetical protein
MVVLRFEHHVNDYNAWKTALDAEAGDRAKQGVIRQRVFRPIADPQFVVVDLEFKTSREAEAFRVAVESTGERAGLKPSRPLPGGRIVELVESLEYTL